MPLDIDPERYLRSPFLIGALGSFVALRFAPGLTWPERAINVASGALCAGFCAPALTEWMHVQTPAMQSLSAFAVGIFGLSFAAAVTTALRNVDMAAIISGWLGRKN